MADRPKEDLDGDLAVKPARKTAKARRYKVIFYNDNYTTKWFVVMVLQQVFHMSEATATSFMLAVHTYGHGVAGVYTKDIAETKATEVQELAKEYEMPLQVSVEADD
jgi:ATP-dependent Clp protease adaptor protein ClpS